MLSVVAPLSCRQVFHLFTVILTDILTQGTCSVMTPDTHNLSDPDDVQTLEKFDTYMSLKYL